MLKGNLMCQRFTEAHNVLVACWLNQWGWLKNSDSDTTGEELFDAYKNYKKMKRDFFWLHWQVNIPEDLDSIRFHVESPPATGSPVLYGIKREVVNALRAGGINHVARRQGYQYDDTRGKTSSEEMRLFKSTEAFRIILTSLQRKDKHEKDIEQVHAAIGSAVDEVLRKFVSRALC